MSILALEWIIGGSFVLLGSACVILRSLWVNRHNHAETLYRVKYVDMPAYLTSDKNVPYEHWHELESIETVRE